MTRQASELQNVSGLSRRAFLGTGISAGAMVLTVGLQGGALKAGEKQASQQLNAFVAIEPDGTVSVFIPFVEMGQGVHTSLAMLIAEELDVPMAQVKVKEAPLGPEYRLHWDGAVRYTGSSLTIKDGFMPMRKAGAAARAMLLQAASEEWGIAVEELLTEAGEISHLSSGRKAAYSTFVTRAAENAPPLNVPLKKSADFKLIGTPTDRLDMVEKTNGTAQFAIDASPPDMLVAAILQSPVFGGRIRALDKDAALAMPGVVAVEAIPNGTSSFVDYVLAPPDHQPNDPTGTVAVVADSFWHAKSALKEVTVEFEGGAEAASDQAFSARLRSRVGEQGVAAEEAGDVDAALADAAIRIEADYEVPLAAHMAMEPMSCTALYEGDRCTLWTGHQSADWVATVASKILAIPTENVKVVTPYLGGSFGRKNNADYVVQAVSLAKRFPGRPIKVIWTREEDTKHDFYRPQVLGRLQAGFDANNNPTVFRQINIGDGPQRHAGFAAGQPFDHSVMDSSANQPYDIPNKRTEYLLEENAVPLGFWRSVGGAHNGFFIESFVDEMAHAVGEDPVAFRRRLLSKSPRFAAVLDKVIEMANWRGAPWMADDGRQHAMGVALHEDHYTIVGEIAEVSLDEYGMPKVHKVWCAVDCGTVVNPSSAAMQVESGIAFGLSAALMEKVEVQEGAVVNSNFHDYPVLTAQEMPQIDVAFIERDAAPTGLGEPATPPIAAAVCNALFTLTGKRIRTLPIQAALS
ncbi:Isoquinoline 1-oxidoreductase subunit beta [Marinovum algicola]|uniref:Isoquinoline 1-oxidoreductase, beta subunit n=1 Tax=Marinovum algicola TaxID=42444 RepID=A0A975ZQT6_9RHOB|nr:xanthine dehydrogenase family protein molybdopterin-binding subunit [Marinovum algicola]SEK09040.1 isoquinoline 1-oxidoreductase, beta subunit [Marinovum algicola]SLN71770.1 Isoquinoline 1-oxidoreductase subunit beta [Marinovum algicola]